jgi:mono/diheme cytochrome c family protein
MGVKKMMRAKKIPNGIAVSLVVGVMLMIFTACGGSDEVKPPTATTIPAPTATTVAVQPTDTPDPTATTVPPTLAPEPTVAQVAADPTATTVVAEEPTKTMGDAIFDDSMGQFDQDLLVIGQEIFEVSAGGLGCAFCHGLDGKGDGPAGIGAPPNRGLDRSKFEAALTDGESGAMEFLQGQLSKKETNAVLEYIAWLGTQP